MRAVLDISAGVHADASHPEFRPRTRPVARADRRGRRAAETDSTRPGGGVGVTGEPHDVTREGAALDPAVRGRVAG
ncbi:hypothetical protein [Streptomyces sp. B21-101]|uniref:hypothetical protein n=1 Tax=Streptomyces sp. B21-101 TaxID=3039415 RepID=UPI002FEFA811